MRFSCDEYSKTPREFLTALQDAPELESCRDALASAGHSWICADSGAKFFVQPNQIDWVRKQLVDTRVCYRHVIVSSEFTDIVDQVVKGIRSRSRPKLKRRIDLVSKAVTLATQTQS